MRTTADDLTTTRYDDDILAIEQRIRSNGFPDRPIAFYGSSSFRLWKSMHADLGSLDIANLGFGGGTNASGVFYFQRVIAPLQPRTIVLYFGENDISNDGLSSETAFADFLRLQEQIRTQIPDCRIFVLSAKQSPTKWLYEDVVRDYNAKVSAWCAKAGGVSFIDVTTALLGESGRPIFRFYEPDLIHLNGNGYAVWSSILRHVPGMLQPAHAGPGSTSLR